MTECRDCESQPYQVRRMDRFSCRVRRESIQASTGFTAAFGNVTRWAAPLGLASFVVAWIAWIAGCTTRATPPRDIGALTSLTVAGAERGIFQDPVERPRLIRLELDGLATLPQEVADVFARPIRHTYRTSLDGLTALFPQAEALVANATYLSLGGLETISPEVAEDLETYRGDLLLNRAASMTPAVAAAVSQETGFLSLNGLTTLSPETARALAGNRSHAQLVVLNGLAPSAGLTGTTSMLGPG